MPLSSKGFTYSRPKAFDYVIDATEATADSITIQVVKKPTEIDLDFLFNFIVRSSAGLQKAGFTANYNITTGVLTISGSFDAGDTVRVFGQFM